jgi:hypothetical protein
LRRHANGLSLRALDDFEPLLWIRNAGTEIETVPVVQRSEIEIIFMRQNVQIWEPRLRLRGGE